MLRVAVLIAFLVVPVVQVVAQRQGATGPLAIGLGAERRGDFQVAATNYFVVLSENPDESQAILGLSRVLPALNRREELVPVLRNALARDSTNIGLLSLAVRTWSLLERPDSARRYAERWSALVEGEEEPFREWAQSALEARDRASARLALETGRRRIAHPAALAPELAQLRQAEGDLAGATSEWIRAVTNAPVYRPGAILMLGDVSPANREIVSRALAASTEVEARRIEGLLLVRWGRAEEGLSRLAAAMPEDHSQALLLIRIAIDQLRNRTDPPSLRARGIALELQAEHESGIARVRTWMEAARAWADAGAEQDARRLLAKVAADPEAPQGVATAASSALLGVLLAEGKPAEAESLLATLAPNQTMDDRDRDARRVALAWGLSGNLARAEKLIEADSSVTGFALRGLLRAFEGDLVGAGGWLQLAGPYDDDREDAVERVRLLALIQAVGRDTLPQLGRSLVLLAKGDTSNAVVGLVRLAPELEPGAAAAVRYYAGELALAVRDTAQAMQLFEQADDEQAPASAPAARFQRAQILAARGDVEAANRLLEQIILNHPDSAVVPAARRFRDALRGAVPNGGAGR
jgi:tetratricopeptide (TPR) repeat protein